MMPWVVSEMCPASTADVSMHSLCKYLAQPLLLSPSPQPSEIKQMPLPLSLLTSLYLNLIYRTSQFQAGQVTGSH